MATVAGSQRQLTHTSNTYESNGDVTIGGNLNINGTTTTIDTANLLVEDKNIVIGDVSSPTNTTADGGGITLKGATDKTINWINSTSSWTSNQTFSAPNLTLTNLSNQSSEATALVVNGSNVVGTRELGSNAFNSTAFLTSYTETDTLATVTARGNVTSQTITISNTLNTTNTIFARKDNVSNYANAQVRLDSFGGSNSLAGLGFHISGSIGKMLFINSSGDLFWDSTSSKIWHAGNDGSGSNLDADLLDGQQGSYYAPIANPTFTGTVTTPNLTIGSGNRIKFANNDYIRYDDANGVGRFHFDADGGTNNASVQAATFVGALSGNASTATKWATARTLSLTGEVTGSVSWDGSGNASLATTMNNGSLDDQYVTVGSRHQGNGSALSAANKASIRQWDVSEATDDPSGSSDGLVLTAGWDSNDWAVQQYHDFHSNDLYLRSKQNGTWMTTWDRVFHDTYHPNADTLTTTRNIALAGDVTGNVNFNGSSNVSITTSLAANSVAANEIAASAVGASELNVSGNGSTSQFLRSDGDGTFTWATPPDNNTTYSAGNGISLSSTTFSVAAGGGLTQTSTGLSHSDTSSQASVNNSSGTVIQDITLDTYGHITAIGSANLDSRYFTETESDARFLRSNADDVLESVLIVDETTGGTIVYNLASDGVYIPKPLGADYMTTNTTQTGAIGIKLPTSAWGTNDMISFHVDIYDYAGGVEGESVTLHIFGYQYQTNTGTPWANVGASIQSDRADRDYTVRFGNDGTRAIVWIGETNSTWSYNQVTVRDFTAGYSAYTQNWDTGWDIVASVTSFDSVNKTVSANYPVAKQLKTARNIALTGAVTGNTNFDGSGNISIATTATADPTLTLSGDASGSATFTNLGNATLSVSLAANSVAANEIAASAVGASELNVSGNGTTAQFLRSDGDGTFTWATPPDTNTTYTLSSFGITASSSELNYTDGVTSNIQTQLNGKLSTSGGTMTGNLQINSTKAVYNASYFATSNASTRSKFRLYYTDTKYAIGMQSGVSYAGLNDWAMTFQFSNTSTRGFWWGDDGHTTAQGAMALTTQGKLSVARTVRVGYGETDTTTPSDSYADYNIPIKHRVYTASTLPSASPAGQRAFISDSAYGLATAIGAVVSGGGSNTIPVYSDGSSWRAG